MSIKIGSVYPDTVPVSVSGNSSDTFTLASFDCARVAAGMADGDTKVISISLEIIDSSTYWCEVQFKYAFTKTAGPTYTLGTGSVLLVHESGDVYDTISLDISANKIRVRCLLMSVNVDCYAVCNFIGG